MPYRVYNTTSTKRCLFILIIYYLRQQDCEKRWSTERQSAVPKVMVVGHVPNVRNDSQGDNISHLCFSFESIKKKTYLAR